MAAACEYRSNSRSDERIRSVLCFAGPRFLLSFGNRLMYLCSQDTGSNASGTHVSDNLLVLVKGRVK